MKNSDTYHNHELLSDLFESVYNTMKNAKVNVHSLARDIYIDKKNEDNNSGI